MVDSIAKNSAATTQRFSYGLRIGVLAISAAMLFPASLFRNLTAYQPLWPQIVAYALDVGLIAAELVLVIRHRAWGRARWAGMAWMCVAAVISELTLPHGAATSGIDWAYGTTSWLSLLLLLDLPFGYMAGFLGAHEVFAVAHLLLSAPTQVVILNSVVAGVSAIGFPFGVVLGVIALRSVADKVHQVASTVERARAGEAVAAALHTRRQQQFASLYVTTMPLLRGLANQTLDPDDPCVQRTCAIEAARMRRLFAETDEVEDPLRHELAHCADVADRCGVIVELDTQGYWPPLSLDIRRALTEVPLAVLTTARSWARITVIGTKNVVSVNVVADSGQIAIPEVDHATVTVNIAGSNELLWVEAKWSASSSPL